MFKQFSPNMLKTYKLCPKKFYLKYIKNISMPVNDDIFEFGKNIHALASYYLKGENIDNMELALSGKEKTVWEYLKQIPYFSYKTINTEYNLIFKIEKHFFSGRIDAIMKNQDTYYILDYKTGAVPENAKYDYQTMIYTYAVSEYYKTDNVIFIYIDLKKQSEIKITLTPALKAEYFEKLKEIADKISQSEVPERKKDCRCEYSSVCY